MNAVKAEARAPKMTLGSVAAVTIPGRPDSAGAQFFSMARGEDPASATTSFFICVAPSTALDGQYTAFGRVVDGMAAVDAIEASPRDGETPTTRIELKAITLQRR